VTSPLNASHARTLSPVSVADAAEAHLRAQLFGGRLRAGQVLRDTFLAEELGIARPTARTAVLRLIAEGLLEREPGHSARVRTFTAADVADIYAVRRLIEFEAVRIITIERRDTAGIADAYRAFENAGDTWEAGPDADAHFHTAVVAAAGSPRLSRTFAGLASEMRLLVALLRTRYATLGELADEHAGLLATLRAGDTHRALALWAEHIDDAERHVLAALLQAPEAATASDPGTRPHDEGRT
jgi:DNA-binding GntR family transcriptional regulator